MECVPVRAGVQSEFASLQRRLEKDPSGSSTSQAFDELVFVCRGEAVGFAACIAMNREKKPSLGTCCGEEL